MPSPLPTSLLTFLSVKKFSHLYLQNTLRIDLSPHSLLPLWSELPLSSSPGLLQSGEKEWGSSSSLTPCHSFLYSPEGARGTLSRLKSDPVPPCPYLLQRTCPHNLFWVPLCPLGLLLSLTLTLLQSHPSPYQSQTWQAQPCSRAFACAIPNTWMLFLWIPTQLLHFLWVSTQKPQKYHP